MANLEKSPPLKGKTCCEILSNTLCSPTVARGGGGGGVELSVDKCIIILCFIVTLPPAPNILSGLRQENFVVVSSSYCLITVVASSTDPT